MRPVELMYENFLDEAVVTSSSINVNFPLTNLEWPWYTKVAQTTGCHSEWFKFDIGSVNAAIGVDRLATKGHNWSSGATIKWYGHASDLGATPADWESTASYKSGSLTWRADQIVKAITSLQKYQWWLLWIQDDGNSDGYLQLGKPYAGTYFAPTYGYSIGYKRRIIDPSDKVSSWGGQTSKVVKQKYRSFALEFADMVSADVETMDGIFFDYLGQGTPYFLCIDTANRDTKTFYVENVTDWEFTNTTADGRADVTIEVVMSR